LLRTTQILLETTSMFKKLIPVIAFALIAGPAFAQSTPAPASTPAASSSPAADAKDTKKEHKKKHHKKTEKSGEKSDASSTPK
jgi:hypothetical protein